MEKDGQLMTLATVAAANIAAAINAPAEQVPAIEQAIKDEVDAVGAQFAMMYADVSESFRQEAEAIRTLASFVKIHWGVLLLFSGLVFSIGALVGHAL